MRRWAIEMTVSRRHPVVVRESMPGRRPGMVERDNPSRAYFAATIAVMTRSDTPAFLSATISVGARL